MSEEATVERRGRRRNGTREAVVGLPAAGNVDKIRDILFGAQMRDYSRRFTRLEETIERALNDLRQDFDGRLQALESFTRSELGALDERLRAERDARSDDHKRIARELESTERTLSGRLGELSDRTSRAEQSLRQQLLDLTRTLRGDLRRHHGEMSDNLDQAVAQLESAKIDRAGLAGLFTEIAMRLDSGLDELPMEAMADLDG